MNLRYDAMEGPAALEQLGAWFGWLGKLHMRPTSIKVAPDVELWLSEGFRNLYHEPGSGVQLLSYRGIRVIVDEALAPRGVVLA